MSGDVVVVVHPSAPDLHGKLGQIGAHVSGSGQSAQFSIQLVNEVDKELDRQLITDGIAARYLRLHSEPDPPDPPDLAMLASEKHAPIALDAGATRHILSNQTLTMPMTRESTLTPVRPVIRTSGPRAACACHTILAPNGAAHAIRTHRSRGEEILTETVMAAHEPLRRALSKKRRSVRNDHGHRSGHYGRTIDTAATNPCRTMPPKRISRRMRH